MGYRPQIFLISIKMYLNNAKESAIAGSFFILCRKAALYRVTEQTLPFVSVSDAPKTIPFAAG